MSQCRFFLLAALVLLLSCSTALAAPGVLRYGAQGDDVVAVQQELAALGYYSGPVDGVFGSGTQQAVLQFQLANGLTADGVVGSETRAYLSRGGEPASVSRGTRFLTMIATAYSAYDDGNGSRTYGGHPVRRGLVAVDPSVIPLGTRLYIEGYGYAVADDIGSAIKGNRIDLAFDSYSEAIQFGRRPVTVYILD